MAKKKSKQTSQPISPLRFLAEKANKIPIYKCFITSNWPEIGLAHAIVARRRGNGNLCVAHFIVDPWCLGVKDAFGDVNMTEENFEDRMSQEFDMEECEYSIVHNLVYGAVEFAGEADLKPAREYWTWKGILEEDSDDVPYIDFKFGKNGKYFLVAPPGSEEALLASKLSKKLGDRFESVAELNIFDSYYDDFPEEEYTYVNPQYPSSPEVRNKFIADELLSKKNFEFLPPPVIDRILALPPHEAASDIKNVVMYEIGRTYLLIDENKIKEPDESAIIHSLLLLAEIKSIAGLDAVLQIMRQNENFLDFHLGDVAFDLIAPALAETGKNNLKAIEDYMYEPGLNSNFRAIAPEALTLIAMKYPEKRSEVIEIFRRLLNSLPERLPLRNACDSCFTGFLMCSLMDLKTPELIPEIEKVFATNLVGESICGDIDDVKKDILSADASDYSRYTRTIKEQYNFLNS